MNISTRNLQSYSRCKVEEVYYKYHPFYLVLPVKHLAILTKIHPFKQ